MSYPARVPFEIIALTKGCIDEPQFAILKSTASGKLRTVEASEIDGVFRRGDRVIRYQGRYWVLK